MPKDRKREWMRPEAHPITSADSRADVRDVLVVNDIIAPSQGPN